MSLEACVLQLKVVNAINIVYLHFSIGLINLNLPISLLAIDKCIEFTYKKYLSKDQKVNRNLSKSQEK